MIIATIGTGLLCLVAFTSYVFVRRRSPYELWYAIHISAYAGIALGWFHQIPTGNDLIHITPAERYWRSLYIFTLVLVAWRVAVPLINAFRHRLRISEVVNEGPGRRLAAHRRAAGSTRCAPRRASSSSGASSPKGFWWAPLPFSLSAAPDGQSFRITIKNLGDHSAKMDRLTSRARASSPRGRSASSPRPRARRRRCCSSPAGSGSRRSAR